MKKEKHNHKLTNLLKVLIFSVIMLAPFFAVLSKTLYITFNPNAKDSYSTEQLESYTKVTTTNNLLIENKTYTYTYTQSYPSNTDYIYFNKISNNILDYFSKKYVYVAFRLTGNANFTLMDSNNNTYVRYNFFTTEDIKTFEFQYKSTAQPNLLIQAGELYLNNITESKIDNAFYYAIDELHEQPIFNWAKDTAIYNALNTFTTGITGTTNSTLALLLAYWFIITAIYIVIDIIIFAFTYLTHFFNN